MGDPARHSLQPGEVEDFRFERGTHAFMHMVQNNTPSFTTLPRHYFFGNRFEISRWKSYTFHSEPCFKSSIMMFSVQGQCMNLAVYDELKFKMAASCSTKPFLSNLDEGFGNNNTAEV